MVLALSAGEYPDVVLAYEGFYNGGLTALIEDEVAIDLTDYAEYMPDYLALINSREDYSRAAISADGGFTPSAAVSRRITSPRIGWA